MKQPDWNNRDCEKCKYRVDNLCRRLPPTIELDITGLLNRGYPQIRMGACGYQRACAEYKEIT